MLKGFANESRFVLSWRLHKFANSTYLSWRMKCSSIRAGTLIFNIPKVGVQEVLSLCYYLFLEKSQFPKIPLVWKNSANANSSTSCFSQKYPCMSWGHVVNYITILMRKIITKIQFILILKKSLILLNCFLYSILDQFVNFKCVLLCFFKY